MCLNYVNGEIIIESFFFKLRAFSDRNNAAVPFDTASEYLHLKKFLRFVSNFIILFPCVKNSSLKD